MADAVTTQILENGPRWWAYSFTSKSDGTGETSVVKVDGSSAGPLGVTIGGVIFYPTSHIKIREIEYNVKGMGLQVIWDATSAQNAAYLDGYGNLRFDRFGGLAAVGSTGAVLTGATGKILFSTDGAMANSGYTIVMRGTKGIQQ